MDWDRVGANDIYIALSSFCPLKGSVRSVRVFVSEFGKNRLAEEEKLGPEELRTKNEEEVESSEEEEDQVLKDLEIGTFLNSRPSTSV